MALAALPACRLPAKPNSKFGGAQIGINALYSFHGAYNGGDECLGAIAPAKLVAYPAVRPGGRAGGGPGRGAGEAAAPVITQVTTTQVTTTQATPAAAHGGRARLTPQQLATRKAAAEIVKVDAIDTFSDEEIDYMFGLARTAGANAISCEIPLSHTKRLGAFGEKHKMMIGYHGHTYITSPEAFGRPASWKTALSYSRFNGINLDIGHFIAGNSASPVPFLEKYRGRVTHTHLKDRKLNNGPNVPFGMGDTAR
jgi:hypothetical protein